MNEKGAKMNANKRKQWMDAVNHLLKQWLRGNQSKQWLGKQDANHDKQPTSHGNKTGQWSVKSISWL